MCRSSRHQLHRHLVRGNLRRGVLLSGRDQRRVIDDLGRIDGRSFERTSSRGRPLIKDGPQTYGCPAAWFSSIL